MVLGTAFCLMSVHHFRDFLGTSCVVARFHSSLKLCYRWGSMGQVHSEALWVKPL